MSADLEALQLVPLCLHQEYIEDCIAVLNQEWPRSYVARERTIKRCLNETPDMSVILISETMPGSVIGHARICLLPSDPEACWVESLIVRLDCRGKGIGRKLMNYVETKSRELGFKKIFLSTEDKYEFYKHCGYVDCPEVLNVGAGSKLFSKFKVPKLMANATTQSNNVSKYASITSNGNTSAPSPPAPPPPPLKRKHKDQPNQIIKRYLTKAL
uniref:N-acetyltransferase domain-containing protein n=1 Tax=Panagrellus redivivus TaxID=6233 RepID=A0A7E4VRH5_PANRE